MTWSEPIPIETTSDPYEVLPPVIVHVHEGSSVTLNWSYNLTLGFSIGFIKLNEVIIVIINKDGSVGPVSQQFQKRYRSSSTPGRASLSIFPVTVADDKADVEFRCELIDSSNNNWKRAIKVQVIGKLESVVD